MSFCVTCNLELEQRNKTGYCTSHRGNWRKKCNSCEELIWNKDHYKKTISDRGQYVVL